MAETANSRIFNQESLCRFIHGSHPKRWWMWQLWIPLVLLLLIAVYEYCFHAGVLPWQTSVNRDDAHQLVLGEISVCAGFMAGALSLNCAREHIAMLQAVVEADWQPGTRGGLAGFDRHLWYCSLTALILCVVALCVTKWASSDGHASIKGRSVLTIICAVINVFAVMLAAIHANRQIVQSYTEVLKWDHKPS